MELHHHFFKVFQGKLGLVEPSKTKPVYKHPFNQFDTRGGVNVLKNRMASEEWKSSICTSRAVYIDLGWCFVALGGWKRLGVSISLSRGSPSRSPSWVRDLCAVERRKHFGSFPCRRSGRRWRGDTQRAGGWLSALSLFLVGCTAVCRGGPSDSIRSKCGLDIFPRKRSCAYQENEEEPPRDWERFFKEFEGFE